MKKNWLLAFPFPLALLAFAGIGVFYFNMFFTTSTRWGFLALLTFTLMFRGQIFAGLRSGFGVIFMSYFFWCISTALWSEVPMLSLLKSLAVLITVLTFVSGGHYWAMYLRPDKPFSYLAPLTLLALIAGIGQRGNTAFVETGAGFDLYQGLAGNPNFLGMMIAISFPYVLYQAYLSVFERSQTSKCFVSFGVIGILAVLLWLSASRASMLCVLITLMVSMSALTSSKKLIVVFLLAFGVLGTAVIAPEIQKNLYERVILKGAESGDVFYTRLDPWKDSYDAALQGGVLGVGYGVSVGHSNFEVGLTAQTYGREKGNTQLAVWEETGLVGLALYTILLLGIFRVLYRGMRSARSDNLRIMLAIVLGMVLGMTVESAFEAWWVAPGSLESAGFWAVVGVGTGLAQRAAAHRKRTGHVGAGGVLPSRGPAWRT